MRDKLPDDRRVMVTGLGALTPLANTMEGTWNKILVGECGIEQIPLQFLKSDVNYAAFVKEFDAVNYMDKKLAERRQRPTHLSVASALQAFADAGLEISDDTSKSFRQGVTFGSGISNSIFLLNEREVFEKKGRLTSTSALKIQAEQAATTVSKVIKLRGPAKTISTACASGASAIVSAAETIQLGHADVMLAGGGDSIVYHPLSYALYEGAKALAEGIVDDPSLISRPFSPNRRGFVLGENYAYLVLESLEHAQARNARIYAEITGYAETNGAGHDTYPTISGQLAALNIATERAGLIPGDIDHVNFHGTATPIGDQAEYIATILYRQGNLEGLLGSATKSMTAHGIGGTGALEAAFLALAIYHGVVPPTPNFDELLQIDPILMKEYSISEYYRDVPVLNPEAIKTRLTNGISSSFGFGDCNAVIVMSKV